MLFPEAMRYLWKDWPAPVKAGASKNSMLNDILMPGEGWQLVGEGYKFTEGPAANAQGEVFFSDIPASKIHKVALDGKIVEANSDSHNANGQHFGPDGRRYVVSGDKKLRAYDATGAEAVIAEDLAGNDLVVAENGNVYVTDPASANNGSASRVWLIKSGGEKQVVETGVRFANGITLSPDQTLLYVADSRSHWVYSYQIQPDGTLAHKQRYYWLHEPDTADDSGADGMCVDRDGRLYVATRLGVQVCDQAGRVNVIIPTPNGRIANLTFGGPEFDTIYATCGDKVFKRKVKARGAQSYLAPIKPKAPGL
jgi:sugar lactone lactonase YvrE